MNPFRSSKGFKSANYQTDQSSALIKSSTKYEDLLCPFPRCGRKFTSDDQLKNHIERRHKKMEENKQQTSILKSS